MIQGKILEIFCIPGDATALGFNVSLTNSQII